MRRTQNYIITVICLVLLAAPWTAQAVKIQNYTFEYSSDGSEAEIVMNVEYHRDRTLVTYFNEYGDKELTCFKGSHDPLSTTYYNPEREVTGTSVYDYRENKVILSGNVNAKYNIKGPLYDNNGSLFYLFSVYYPQPEKRIKFKMVQSNLARITDPLLRLMIIHMVGPIEMSLKHIGQEVLVIEEKEMLAEKYEFGISEGTLSSFWPHKYYFWYSQEPRHLLKHTGMSNIKKPNQYILTGFFEWERPIPELPAL
jgi:hypothetical protein